MKMLRIFAIAGGVLVALLVATIAVLYAMFDEKAIKDELTRQVEVKTGRTLLIDGALALSVWPDVALRIGRLTLSEADGKSQFAALDSARVAVAVLPLLSQRLEARHIEIEGLALTLIKHKDGSLNISDLMAGPEKPGDSAATKPASDGGASTPLHIDIAGVALRHARLTWRDEAAGQVTELADLDFTSGRLFGDVATQSLMLEKLAFSTRGKTGDELFELALDLPSLQMTADSVLGKSLNLLASLQGEQRQLTAKLSLAGVNGSVKKLQAEQFSLDLDGRQGDAAFKANLTSPLAYEAAGRTLTLEKILGAVDVTSPALPMKQLKLLLTGEFAADLAKQTATLAINTKLDASNIGLTLAVNRFSPLNLAFGLDIDQFNVDRYLPPAPAATSHPEAKTGPGKGSAPEAKIDLTALKGLNLRGDVKIGQLQARHLKLSKLEARLAAANGTLDIAPLNAALYGGRLDGSLRVNAGSHQFTVKQKFAGISIQPLLKDLLGKEPLEGRGTLSLDLLTRGETVTALKKALSGQAALNLKDGAVKGVNVARMLREVESGLAGKAPTAAASSVEKTDFSALSASFKIAAGVAHNDDLQMMSPFLRLGGTGDIDIGNERIDYLAKVSVVNTATGQEGKSLDRLKGITVPLRLRGPFNQLSYSLEVGSLVEEAAKAQLEKNKEKLKAKAVEKLGDQLKGLFGR